MDIFDTEKRSAIMASIRGRHTKPELLVRRYLHRRGLRFRLHDKNLPGCPDLVFPGRKATVFVHGCFWHGHEGCRRAKLPTTREEFWRRKIGRNRERDEDAERTLKAMGWQVIVVWTCEMGGKRLEALYEEVVSMAKVQPSRSRTSTSVAPPQSAPRFP